MTKKPRSIDIPVYVEGHKIKVNVINQSNDPVTNFKTELWIDHGKRYEANMPEGTYTWHLAVSPKTTIWIFIEGEYGKEEDKLIVNWNQKIENFASNYVLDFKIDETGLTGVDSVKK